MKRHCTGSFTKDLPRRKFCTYRMNRTSATDYLNIATCMPAPATIDGTIIVYGC